MPYVTREVAVSAVRAKPIVAPASERLQFLGEIRQLSLQKKWLPGTDENANYEFAIPLRQNAPHLPKQRKRDRDRAEALRLAGGPKPTLRQRAVVLARERGEVRTAELTAVGIPRCYLARMCEEGLLVKVAYGRYRAADLKAASLRPR